MVSRRVRVIDGLLMLLIYYQVSRRVGVIDGLLMLLIYYHGRQESQGYRWVVNVIDLLSWSPGESGLGLSALSRVAWHQDGGAIYRHHILSGT